MRSPHRSRARPASFSALARSSDLCIPVELLQSAVNGGFASLTDRQYRRRAIAKAV